MLNFELFAISYSLLFVVINLNLKIEIKYNL